MELAIPQTFRKYSPYAITVDEYVQSDDEKKIRRVFETMQTAWAGKDAVAFGSCFSEESDFISSRGDHYKGRDSNIKTHKHLFVSVLKNTRLYVNIKDIRFLSSEMAVVHAEGTVLNEFETVSNTCNLSYTTNILIKENGEWKITSFHNSRKQNAGIIRRIIKWFIYSLRVELLKS